jgi:hypothetical protein
MKTWLIATALAVSAAILLVGLSSVSCGGGKRSLSLPLASGPDGALDEDFDAGLDLVMTRDVSGAPSGVKLYWWRVNVPNTTGYYAYRDTQPITEANPALRVNGGNQVPQPPEGTTAILFDDKFSATEGVTYYYRVTAVDIDGDESRLSQQRSITIQDFMIEGFSPIQGRVGQTVSITGRRFSEYNEATDAVYFTGVKNNKGPSALRVDQVQATILTWEDNRIRVSVPIGSTVGRITVQSNSTQQQTSGDFQCLSPYILSFDPDPVNTGYPLSFYGANFGLPDGTNLLLVDDVPYGGVFRSWSDDQVMAIVPDEITTGLHKFEMLIDGEVTNHCWIDVIATYAPYISSITPNYAVRNGDYEIHILGRNFGTIQDDVDVVFNGVSVSSDDFSLFSDTEISFPMPADTTLVGEVYVIRHDTTDVSSNHYIYHALNGWQESLPEGVAAGFNMGEYSDTAYDYNSGAEYVIFTDNTPNNYDSEATLFLAYWDSGESEWVSEVLVSTWEEMRWPRIAVDTNGIVHYAYQHYGWMSEVRYGTWEPGVGVTGDEQVYQAGSTDTPGDDLDMYLNDDGSGNVDIVLAWSMNGAQVQCGYRMSGASGWTVNTVYTADGAYSEEVGFYCSVDVSQLPVFSPPHGPSSLGASSRRTSAIGGGSFIAGITFGLYSPDYTPNWEVRLCYSFDLDTWNNDSEIAGTSSDPITETVLRWQPGTATQNILWCTDNEVRWARDDDGYIRETVTSGDGPYGAAVDLFVYGNGDQYAVGHSGEYTFFKGFRGDPDYTWNLEYVDDNEYREPTHVGRGGAQIIHDGSGFIGAHFSCYDAAMRDVAWVQFWDDMSSGCPWEDIADGFATPGHLLSNQAVVLGEDGRPNVVFSDIDPQSGERSLWFGHFTGVMQMGGFSHVPWCQWEYTKLDSNASGTLGRATMSLDASGDFHIAYQRSSQMVYMSGNPTDGFSSPAVLETFTAIPTAGPQIALGTDSTQDVYIATQRPGSNSEVVLLESDDNMASHSLKVVFSTANVISQYDVAARYADGRPVVAAYLEGATNSVSVYDDYAGSTFNFPETAGMNKGLTLTLDDLEHYCITVADISGGGGGYLLEWDDEVGDYVLNEFTSQAAYSMTMSQCRVEYGPVMTYVDGGYVDDPGYYWADTYVSMLDDMGRNEVWIDWYEDEEDISVYHSLDAYEPFLNVYATHATVPTISNLYVGTYVSWE